MGDFRGPGNFTGSMSPKSMLLSALHNQGPQRWGRRNPGRMILATIDIRYARLRGSPIPPEHVLHTSRCGTSSRAEMVSRTSALADQ
jgi:hypothetical protein